MWVLLALLSAVGGALTALALKAAVGHGGALRSTVAYRTIAGVLLLAIVAASGGWPGPSPAWWRACALVLPPEIAGTLLFGLALGAGELSLVQPLMGMLPLFVAVGGVLVLREVPSAPAAIGIALVALERGTSPLAPLRALVRSRASWYAMGAAFAWTFTSLGHKAGIAAVGALPWAVTLSFGSALLLAVGLPFVARRTRASPPSEPRADRRWPVLVALTGAAYALQQVGLQLALFRAQAGYVVAVSAVSTLLAIGLGILVLGERGATVARIGGGLLVTAGAAIIALFG